MQGVHFNNTQAKYKYLTVILKYNNDVQLLKYFPPLLSSHTQIYHGKNVHLSQFATPTIPQLMFQLQDTITHDHIFNNMTISKKLENNKELLKQHVWMVACGTLHPFQNHITF